MWNVNALLNSGFTTSCGLRLDTGQTLVKRSPSSGYVGNGIVLLHVSSYQRAICLDTKVLSTQRRVYVFVLRLLECYSAGIWPTSDEKPEDNHDRYSNLNRVTGHL